MMTQYKKRKRDWFQVEFYFIFIQNSHMLANRGKRDELFLISAKIKIENSKLIFDISAIKRKKYKK